MIDYLLKDDNEKREEIFSVYPQMKEKINILYSPTFRSDGRDNTQEVIEAVDTKKYNLIFTFHPKNNIIVSKDVISHFLLNTKRHLYTFCQKFTRFFDIHYCMKPQYNLWM